MTRPFPWEPLAKACIYAVFACGFAAVVIFESRKYGVLDLLQMALVVVVVGVVIGVIGWLPHLGGFFAGKIGALGTFLALVLCGVAWRSLSISQFLNNCSMDCSWVELVRLQATAIAIVVSIGAFIGWITAYFRLVDAERDGDCRRG